MVEKQIKFSEETRQHLKEWIIDLLTSSEMIWGLNPKSLYDEDLYQGKINPVHQLDHTWDDELVYSFYLDDIEFSDEDYGEIANAFVHRLMRSYPPALIVASMANNIYVLMDEARSVRWLGPFAKAERTSIAYERGIRLARHRCYGMAHAIMQDAADKGDDVCAMYLIRNLIEGQKYGFEGGEPTTVEVLRSRYSNSSLAYETALVLIDLATAEQQIHKNGGMEKIKRAQDILRCRAETGDVKSALYLIKQTLHKSLKIEAKRRIKNL